MNIDSAWKIINKLHACFKPVMHEFKSKHFFYHANLQGIHFQKKEKTATEPFKA